MYAAYDALSASIKRRIEGKRAVHSYRKTYDRIAGSTFRPPLTEAQKQEVQEVDHPIVRTHPETGRKALFVNEGFTTRIVDMANDESEELLRRLFLHSTEGRFTYRHHWQEHDIVLWDNRCTIHFAHGCPPELRRHMHRTTVKGDIPR
jgi:taurine dioxygenase